MPTILHISHEDRSADILASEVKAIIRIPESPADDICPAFPPRTKIEYGNRGVFMADISSEEHEALVVAWRSAT